MKRRIKIEPEEEIEGWPYTYLIVYTAPVERTEDVCGKEMTIKSSIIGNHIVNTKESVNTELLDDIRKNIIESRINEKIVGDIVLLNIIRL